MTTEPERPSGGSETSDTGHVRWRAAEWLLILFAPPAAWLLFGIVLINQNNQIDPWFYLGFGRAFHTLHDIFGWPYYAVRFPVVFLNGLFLSGEHPLIGYAVLRYLIVLSCGLPLYIWARARLGRPAAVVGFLFLVSNPLFPRVILWDLTPFVSVPMALAAMVIWLHSDGAGARFLSGLLMMTSVAAHAFTGTALLTFLAIQVIRRLRAREFHDLIRKDVLVTGLGAIVCFAGGGLYYYARIGPFDPRVLITGTLWAAGVAHEYARSHATPFSTWAVREYHVYVPLICVVMTGVLLGRRVLHNTAVASAWWFGVAYMTAYLVYQVVFGRFVLETFYYFAHLSLVVYLLVPVIVAELTIAAPAPSRHMTAMAAGTGLLLLPLAQRLVPAFGTWLDSAGRPTIGVWLGVGVAGMLVLAGVRSLRARSAAALLCMFLLTVQLLTFLNPTHRRVFDSSYRAEETGAYIAAIQMLDVFAAASTPKTPVMLWVCSHPYSIVSVASTVLLYSVSNPFALEPCGAQLGEYERERLTSQRPRYLLLMNDRPDAFGVQEASLRREGYEVQERLTRSIGNEAYRAIIRLVEITRVRS